MHTERYIGWNEACFVALYTMIQLKRIARRLGGVKSGRNRKQEFRALHY